MSDKQNSFNEAGLGGLVLGAVSIVYLVVTHLLSKLSLAPVLSGTFSVILWVVKFAGCIIILRYFMKRHLDSSGDASSFGFGCLTSLLSGLVYAAFYFIYCKYISPEMYTEAFNTLMNSYSSMLDQNMLDQIRNLEPSLPVISFFSNLLWCSIIGVVISAIISKNIYSSNPFDDDSIDQQ